MTDLEKELTWKFPNIAKEAPEQIAEASVFCEGYKEFLNRGKTERECVREAERLLKNAGYTVFDSNKQYRPGDKVYYINRNKSIIATTFGNRNLEEGVRINGAHIDSPRLDLKPNPLFEKDEIAFLKTHYYGGIQKYQWGTIPLAIHGVVIGKNGEAIEIKIGEEENEPVFCITDLLPHLASKHNQRKLGEGLKGEELTVIVGSLPVLDEEVKQPFKLYILDLLHKKYGITERDFHRAEIEIVPAMKARDVGFDRSLIGAYGQDDRVCAYTALMAEIETKSPAYTTVTVLTDKEEIGSEGTTGLNSDYLKHYLEALAEKGKINVRKLFAGSLCLSSDVNGAYDPKFSDVYDPANSCYINKGCVLTKYTGARGKSSSNDAGAEIMARVIDIMDKHNVFWQSGELGAVDAGGGGTIAKYVAHMNIDVVDLGVPVLCMHSPFELTSKLDVYHTYKAFRAFFEE